MSETSNTMGGDESGIGGAIGGSVGRASPAAGAEPFVRQLGRAPARRRPELLLSFLRAQIARRLDIEPGELDPRQQLTQLGMSSLHAVELKQQLESELGLQLRSSLMFDYPTLETLVPFMLQRMRLTSDAVEAKPVGAAPVAPVATALAPDEDRDLAAQLLGELEALRRGDA